MNLKKTITVTVGISAYNEEANIGNLLNSVLNQKLDNYKLEKIIVVSDGSTDSTEKKVIEINSDKIKLIADGKRLGKPIRINQIFREADSEIAVIFDADIKLEDDFVLYKLIMPFLNDDEIMLV
ncbi:MAG: biofilm synthesis PgaC-like N-glycosyltransferase, partial [Parcubacteria group bacterium]|nr:biofilm synthesis PgaC-like N-glycosyltransferase [Parcubacteria group bacterium]